MITKQLATTLQRGNILHHVTLTNGDGIPVRARVNGKCQVWKTRKEDFKLPMKYGLKDCFYITPFNASEWVLSNL